MNVVALTSQPDKEGMLYTDPWVIDCSQEEVLACYAGWEPEVQELLKVRLMLSIGNAAHSKELCISCSVLRSLRDGDCIN